jgi:WD40 repeat protein
LDSHEADYYSEWEDGHIQCHFSPVKKAGDIKVRVVVGGFESKENVIVSVSNEDMRGLCDAYRRYSYLYPSAIPRIYAENLDTIDQLESITSEHETFDNIHVTDASQIVSYIDGTVIIWDCINRKETRKININDQNARIYLMESKKVIVLHKSSHMISVYNYESDVPIAQLTIDGELGTSCVTFENCFMITVLNKLKVFEVQDNSIIDRAELVFTEEPTCIEVIPSGKLAIGFEYTVNIIDFETENFEHTLKHNREGNIIAIGLLSLTTLATSWSSRELHEVKVWDFKKEVCLFNVPLEWNLIQISVLGSGLIASQVQEELAWVIDLENSDIREWDTRCVSALENRLYMTSLDRKEILVFSCPVSVRKKTL